MATTFNMIDIMNAALVSEGFYDIASEDGTDEWRVLSRNWPSIVEAEMEDSLLSFTKKQETLYARHNGKFGFPDAYEVPCCALHVRRLWIEDEEGNRTGIDWVQDSERVYCDYEDGVVIEYIEAADPAFWTALFSRGVQFKLQAVLCAFKEEHATAERRNVEADSYFQRARAASSKSRSATEPFVRSRYWRARYNRG